ncbi:mannose-6-phosphate isomerase, class I [Antrihabitans sp. YC3-6]|uniref:mannose-6-phosphate isomerase n=1 Tax=Antrihabitans stalagmiti TaxID=2799499 RepID=A0A934U1B6_9NOCA|nr:mannose-6-phosphate isomerase, class I [Antrihabitans stalagmiti]MBJ8338414.1 mannose-6-phosphate isomerase, class I [Antrihabitans stalagmiti]
MHLLRGALRNYAWGSRTALAELCGRPVPSVHPEAEMWFGAHPADPARLLIGDDAVSLLDAVAADPVRELGSDVAPRFGNRLPFLLKLLAAEEPLSLQAHPSAIQARDGFARENRARVPIDAPTRNYRDDSPKPELVVALDRFEALAGFRDPHATIALFAALEVPALAKYSALLAGQPDSSGLRALFTTWITLPERALATLLPEVLDGCVAYLSASHGRGQFGKEVRTAIELADTYPGDAGVLCSLLLNRITLQPGEGLYLDAGNLHAYLRGVAVEIMANSDNVLRGGLTPKHVDVPELLRVLDFEPVEVPILHPGGAGGARRYPTPAAEFALSRIDLDATNPTADVTVDGPNILLCTKGSVQLRSGDTVLELRRGAAAWVSAADAHVSVTTSEGNAQMFCASVGRAG